MGFKGRRPRRVSLLLTKPGISGYRLAKTEKLNIYLKKPKNYQLAFSQSSPVQVWLAFEITWRVYIQIGYLSGAIIYI